MKYNENKQGKIDKVKKKDKIDKKRNEWLLAN